MYFQSEYRRRELAQDGAFVGARSGVPLGRRSPTGNQKKRIRLVRRLGHGTRRIEKETGASVGSVEPAVSKEASVLHGRARGGAWLLGNRFRVVWLCRR